VGVGGLLNERRQNQHAREHAEGIRKSSESQPSSPSARCVYPRPCPRCGLLCLLCACPADGVWRRVLRRRHPRSRRGSRSRSLLDRAGFSVGEIDGRDGSNLRKAVSFQQAKSLPPTGRSMPRPGRRCEGPMLLRSSCPTLSRPLMWLDRSFETLPTDPMQAGGTALPGLHHTPGGTG